MKEKKKLELENNPTCSFRYLKHERMNIANRNVIDSI